MRRVKRFSDFRQPVFHGETFRLVCVKIKLSEEADLIEVRNLTKRYGNHIAVEDLNFTIEQGRIYGFLGPNGAGKSTTMNIMTGYLAPSAGDVLIDGVSIVDMPEKAKAQIGYLPELPPLYMDMTVREYLSFAAELRKVPHRKSRERCDAVMADLSLTECADRLIRNLSKGFRQRVGLAQALVHEPEILILDEPMVGLDPKQIIEIRELIRNLGKKHTVILSSHILAAVSEICDTLLILSGGKLKAVGSPAELSREQSGTVVVTVTSPAEKEKLLAALSPKLAKGKVHLSSDPDGLVRAEITLGEENFKNNPDLASDPRRFVSNLLAQSSCPYYSVEVMASSLEKIFLDLTGEKGEPDKKPKNGKEAENGSSL